MMSFINPYFYFQTVKNYLYNNRYIHADQYLIPVISIGNLTTGGTGKTPFTLWLIDFLISKFAISQDEILVISKSYKAKLNQPSKVDLLKEKPAQLFGDEACLIQNKFQKVNVWSGPHKNQTLKEALKHLENKIKVILIDDGFSHRKVNVKANFVMIDVSRKLSHYRLLPFGHLREPLSEISRASLVVLTKVEEKNNETYDFFKNICRENSIECVEALFSSEITDYSANEKYLLFSGIGNFKQLIQSLHQQAEQILYTRQYADHYQFQTSDLAELSLLLEKEKADYFLTTEKDLVKIKDPVFLSRIKLITLKINITEQNQVKVYESLRKILS